MNEEIEPHDDAGDALREPEQVTSASAAALDAADLDTLDADLRRALQHQRAEYERVLETQRELEELIHRARALLAAKADATRVAPPDAPRTEPPAAPAADDREA